MTKQQKADRLYLAGAFVATGLVMAGATAASAGELVLYNPALQVSVTFDDAEAFYRVSDDGVQQALVVKFPDETRVEVDPHYWGWLSDPEGLLGDGPTFEEVPQR